MTAPHPSAAGPKYDAWAIAAPGLESLLERELRSLGFADTAASPGGVRFSADADGLARANLWSRLASRVVVRLASFRAMAFHELERAARKVEWARILGPGRAFRLRVTTRKSRLYHSDAVAERVRDAVLRAVPAAVYADDAGGDDGDAESWLPPEMDAAAGEEPQLFLVRFDHDRCTISADSSGALLHRRGYRQAVARAPLRETLAAAMLVGAGYDPTRPLVDPFCGSGTLLIEAALMARRIAPGLGRAFAAEHWPETPPAAWLGARAACEAERLPRAMAPIVGSDRDAGAVEAAVANAARAGVSEDVAVQQRPLSELEAPAGPGLLVTNPPYGIRVGERAPLRDLYARLGQVARAQCPGWRVALLSADRTLDGHTGLDFREVLRTSNGGIPVRLVVASV